jgi:hypothetical protein
MKPGPADDRGAPFQGQAFEFINRELKLDAAQRVAYSNLRDEHQATQRPLQDNIRSAKDNFFALLQQPSVSEADLNVYGARIAAAEQQLNINTFKHFQQLRLICNKGQQQKFDSIIQQVLRNMGPSRHEFGPPPPGRDGGESRLPPAPPGDNNHNEGIPPPPADEKRKD